MSKRAITLLLAAISIALVGLVAIQVVWIRKTMALREDQFAQGIGNALSAVSERIERTERMREMKRHRAGRQLLFKLDSLQSLAAQIDAHEDQLLEEETALEELQLEGEDVLEAPEPPPDMRAPSSMHEGHPIDPQEYEQLVTEMLRGIVQGERSADIRRRMDAHLLDSLLGAELARVGIESGFRYGIFSAKGRWVKLPGEHVGSRAELIDAPFRERLFKHDVGGVPYYLHVDVRHRRAALFSGLLPMLIASVLFIGLIALGFVLLIRFLLRQKRLNDIRNDLVNNLTHELKTPISTISLACEALADPSVPKTEQQVRAFTAMIRDENKRLGALVENVLQSAVQDSGRMLLKPVDLDLHTVISDVVRSSTMQVSRRNGRIELDLQAEIHGLRADRIHLTNVLYNLIDNAVKYTEKEPRIRIATSSNDEGIVLRITDNGIGMPASEHRKIFDKLYRVPTGNLHNAKGFGLGLSYAKSVVERHGGRITVESTPGQGSTFVIHLPFEHVQADQTARR
ncbi:MAG: HAMP domain-containing histidine kinase [Flavobacteriales bacterium]|nr:HAMP domain-containing histidine kinase [Flavobacteriales bacterium]